MTTSFSATQTRTNAYCAYILFEYTIIQTSVSTAERLAICVLTFHITSRETNSTYITIIL